VLGVGLGARLILTAGCRCTITRDRGTVGGARYKIIKQHIIGKTIDYSQVHYVMVFRRNFIRFCVQRVRFIQ